MGRIRHSASTRLLVADNIICFACKQGREFSPHSELVVAAYVTTCGRAE